MSIWLSVSLLQQVHVNRHRDPSFLRPGVSHDRFVRQGLVGDGQATEGAGAPAGRQESIQQEVRFKVRIHLNLFSRPIRYGHYEV